MFTKHRLSLKPHNSSEKLPTVSRLKTRLCSLWIARRKKREARLNLYLMILNVQLCRRHKVNCKINRLNLKFFIIQIKACKFDFERGIGAWAKTGTAFNNQPTVTTLQLGTGDILPISRGTGGLGDTRTDPLYLPLEEKYRETGHKELLPLHPSK